MEISAERRLLTVRTTDTPGHFGQLANFECKSEMQQVESGDTISAISKEQDLTAILTEKENQALVCCPKRKF